MKKSTLIANLCVWGLLLAISIAFQVWYRTAQAIEESYTSSLPYQEGILHSGPVIMMGIGVIAALIFVQLKGIVLKRGARRACRLVGLLFIALLAVSAVSVPAFAQGIPLTAFVVVGISYGAPVLYVIAGVLYGLGCAPLDPNQPKPRITGPFTPDEED